VDLDDLKKAEYRYHFEATVAQIELRRKNDTFFTRQDLEALLHTHYVKQGNDWIGKGGLQHVIESATIAAYEVVLAEWKAQEQSD